MLSSKMHSPEYLASHPPTIKMSGSIPMDSDAHGIMPEHRLLQRDQAVAVISFTARARAVLFVIQLWCRGVQPQEVLSPIQTPSCMYSV